MDLETSDLSVPEPNPATGDEFGQKIDQLLSSALKDQVEIDKQERHALESLRNDVSRMRQELTAARRAAENPSSELFDELKKLMTSIGANVAEVPTHIRSGNEAYSTAVIKKLVGESAQLHGAIQASSTAFGEKVALEATQLRQAVDKRLSAMERVLQAQEQSVDARLTVISEVVTGRLADIADSLATDVETAQEAIFEHVTQSQGEAAENSAEAIKQLKAFIAAGVTSAVSEEVAPFVVRLEKLAERVELADHRITDSNDRVRQMERSLVEFLTDRDDAMEARRDQALLGLVDRMSESLGKRGRAKVAEAIREAQQRVQDEKDAKRFRESAASPIDIPKKTQVPNSVEAHKPIEKEPARPVEGLGPSSTKQDWASQWIQPGRLKMESSEQDAGSYVFPPDERESPQQESDRPSQTETKNPAPTKSKKSTPRRSK